MEKVVTPAKQHQLMFQKEASFFWFTSLRSNIIFHINKVFKGKKTEDINILDIGCGTGMLVKQLREIGYNASGLDYSDTAIELCQKRGLELGKNLFHESVFEMKFETELFDCVTINDVFFAFEPNEVDVILKNIKKILKPGGYILGQTAAFNFLYSENDVVAGTKYRYSAREIKQYFKSNELSPYKVCYRNFVFFLPFLIKRMVFKRKNVSREEAKSDLRDMNKFVNSILEIVFKIDNFFLRYISYPFGGTVFFVGRK